ncbi:MAG: pyruvate synthase subunit PorB [Sulfolobaceae archaeon]|nr:pyruvate synthase subunit PorB [Sulfolobaceae archaeon]
MIRLQDLTKKKYLLPGNAACPGCPLNMGLRYVGMAFEDKTVLVVPAGCTSVIQGLMPKTGINMPLLNIAFAASPAAAAGLATALALRGKDAIVVSWAGDGGSADIGFASLSGAAERNDNIIHIVADNEAYMNTGIQRSSLTPFGAWTTTTVKGKQEQKKDLPLIMWAHKVPYIATASVGYPIDFIEKLKKAQQIKGFKYIHLHAPCPVGWRFDPGMTVEVAKLAVQTGMWILFEAENGKIRISPTSRPYANKKNRTPLEEYLKLQGRFEKVTPEMIKKMYEEIDNNWRILLELEEITSKI